MVFGYDALCGFFSLPIAVAIRFGHTDFYSFPVPDLLALIWIAFALKVVFFKLMKLSGGIWRFSSMPDLILIMKAVTLATLFSAIAFFFYNRLDQFPRSVFLIDWFLCFFLLGGGRFSYRIWKEEKNVTQNRIKTLIIGAGEAGEQLIREIHKDSHSLIQVVGLVDDNKGRHQRTIHGVEVLGSLSDLPEIIQDTEAVNAFIAIPTATAPEIRKIVEQCLQLELKVKTLPALRDLVDGKVHISNLRPVNVEDLLSREPVTLNLDQLGNMIKDKTILVSGAGGSIGSELCNQILKFTPKKIILFEICEYFIYQAENNLKDQFPNQEIICVVGDIRDESRVNETFSLHSPDIVFHAAAYKHVPMMESNPLEAVKTNIKGTLNLAQASIAHKVKKFVMISTDKAVNPTNIMGATKRVAEMICQSFQMKNITEFIVLRFGNVLGSAGSVIPRFLDQIKAGGPVTVTHPEITRYFMSIPEATQLVLQAGALGRGGEIYILDMGQPVKIIDLARDLILLAGFKPGEDIEIKITGLRPGEKLYEELLADTENTIATEHKLVRVAKARQSTANFHQQLNHALANNNAQTIRLDIQQMVPEYEPKGV